MVKSRICVNELRHKPEFLRAFYSLVAPEPSCGCWLWAGRWRGSRTVYGLMSWDGAETLAHRVSYEIHKGPIPAGLIVRHTCDLGVCVNPDHLQTGTHKDNARDMVERGRHRGGQPSGSLNTATKLNELQVAEIRVRRDSGETLMALAKEFGVSDMCIHYVMKTNWRRVP